MTILLCASGVSAGPSVNSEIFQGIAEKPLEPLQLRAGERAAALSIALPETQAAGVRAAAQKQPGKPIEVGFGREIPAPFSQVLAPEAFGWAPMDDGEGQVASVRVRSPEASAVRAGIHVVNLPDELELRVHAPGDEGAPRFLITGREINTILARDRNATDPDAEIPLLYWSPVVPGETVGLEFYLPAGVSADTVRIAIPKLSHIYDWSLEAPDPVRQLGSQVEPMGITDSGDCTIDVGCHSDDWGDISRAVAKMYFTTDSGLTGTCSGTLVNDMDPKSQIPYFLTARHCIQTQPVASSLNTFFFFRKPVCGAPEVSVETKILSNGATLLEEFADTDTTLLRLNDAPPVGATMAGWDTNPVPPDTPVTNLSYPQGDLQKIAFGTVEGFSECLINDAGAIQYCSQSPITFGGFLFTLFDEGMPQQGSSGSAIFRNDTQQIVGVYSIVWWRESDGNGRVDCGEEVSQNDFGRFDRAWEAGLHRWLGDKSGCDAEPGSWAYCFDPACGPCGVGEGDCDSHSECSAGLVCANDVGANYGFESSVDVCEAPPESPVQPVCTLSPDDWQYCADPACGPCFANEGDCDLDAECLPGLVCRHQGGEDDGSPESIDRCGLPETSVCERPVGDWAYCSDSSCGPCSLGQGDCDSDSDCAAGLVCGLNRGSAYGLPAELDVCVEPEGSGCTRSPGDWEFCTDPACGPCTEGQGDCDSDAECATGLSCASNSGEAYGLPANMDVCKPEP